MHDAHRGHARHDGVVQVAIEFFQRLLHAPAAYIQLRRHLRLIFVAWQCDSWLALHLPLLSRLRCRLPFADALDVINTGAETHRSHLYLGFAAISREAEQFGILPQTEDAYSIPYLQWPVQLLRWDFGFRRLAAWGRSGRYSLLQTAHGFARRAQPLAR